MEVGLKKTEFHCFDTIFSQKIKKEVSQDMVVPDTMPDIAEVLDVSGIFVIRSKEMAREGVRVTGNLPVHILYKAEESGEICLLEMSIPVDVLAEAILPDESGRCSAMLQLLSVDARALNPRKVMVRAEVSAQIECFAETLMQLAEDVQEATAGVYTQTKKISFAPITSVEEKTFVLTDELVLPAANAAAGELLSKDLYAMVEEVKTLGSKLIFKGTLFTKLIYRSMDGLPAVAEFSTSFSQIMECDTAFVNGTADIHILPTGVYWELPAGGDGRTVHLEAHMLAQATANDCSEIFYISDAYSNLHPLELHRNDMVIPVTRQCLCLKESLREVFDLPITLTDILNTRISCGEAVKQEAGFELPLCVHVLGKSASGELCAVKKKSKMIFRTELAKEDKIKTMRAAVREVHAVCMGSSLELRLMAELCYELVQEKACAMVHSVQQDELIRDISQLPSVVMLRANQNCDLWPIAKEHCSSVQLIREVNALSGDETWEKFLLIPKCR